MDEQSLNFEALRYLRELFLRTEEQDPARDTHDLSDYWTEELLAQYHHTFAQRIGWKWQSVIKVLRPLLVPTPDCLLDFGCGTGIAAATWAEAFAPKRIEFWDRSPLARQFAHRQVRSQQSVNLVQAPTDFKDRFVLLSHLSNELSSQSLDTLVSQLRTSAGFCWVEPGTPSASHTLTGVRKRLLDQFAVLAPCPHQGPCGLEASDHWCHAFASPPSEVFTSRFWKRFGTELGIDLRSLPTSFLAMSPQATISHPSARILGRPRVFKGYALVDLCTAKSVEQHRLLKKKNPELFEKIKEPGFFRTILPLED